MQDEIIGRAQNGVGKLQTAAGDALDSNNLRAEGAANQVKGSSRAAAGKVQEKIHDLADKVSTGVAGIADRGVAAYDRAADRAQQISRKVEPVVRERPFASTGVALGVGVVIGLLLAGRGPKVIYVKPRDY